MSKTVKVQILSYYMSKNQQLPSSTEARRNLQRLGVIYQGEISLYLQAPQSTAAEPVAKGVY